LFRHSSAFSFQYFRIMNNLMLCTILYLSCASALRISKSNTDRSRAVTSTVSNKKQSENQPDSDSVIPHILHMVWIPDKSKSGGEMPDQFQFNKKMWKETHPNWEIKVWNDEANRKLIAEDYAWFLPTYDSLTQIIYKVDAMKYVFLHKYGGVYTDLDTLPSFNIENVTQGEQLIMMKYNEAGGNINNNFYATVAGHPYFLDLMKGITGLAPLSLQEHHKYGDTLCLTGWMLTTPIWTGKYKGKLVGSGTAAGLKYRVEEAPSALKFKYGIQHQFAHTWVSLSKITTNFPPQLPDHTYEVCDSLRPGSRDVLLKIMTADA